MKKITLLLLLGLLFSCQKQKNHPYAFYYWKTHLSLDTKEKNTLQKSTLPYLYTRFFDIEKKNSLFQPIGVITKDQTFETDKEIVPVIFIKNETFYNIESREILFLAQKVLGLTEKKQNELNVKPSKEIQIDCDWTKGTKKDYFAFLQELKKISGNEITCTLRLHQVKDQNETGIPPVKKAYLMCYSTSSPLENSEKNSILDVKILKNYLQNIDQYPLKLDVALPIYSWGIVTNHLGKHKLINGLSKKDLENPNFKKMNENEIEITKDGFYFGNFLSKGFEIKIEEVSENQLDEVKSFLDNKLSHYDIVYYHLDGKFVQNHQF